MDTCPDIKAVVWVPRFWPAMGGTELHSSELARHLSASITVTVITHCDSTARVDQTLNWDMLKTRSAQLSDGEVMINRVGMTSLDWKPMRWIAKIHPFHRSARAIFSLFYRLVVPPQVSKALAGADVVHCIYNGLTDAAVYSCGCAKRAGIPFVFTPNVLDTRDEPSAWNSKRFKRLYRKSDAIIALTRHEAEYLIRQGADPNRLHVIPYGPVLEESGDADRAREFLGLPVGKRVILFLGRVVSQKGYALLLEAFDRVEQHYPDLALVFMGPASSEVKARLGREQHRNIYQIDSPDQALKADMLAASELVCVPSTAESLGVVYLEAFACRKPVVALDLPVLRDVITEGHDGFLVSPDIQSVADALITLLGDPDRARQMGRNGYDKVMSRYTWESVEQDVLGVYTRAVDASQSNGRP